MKIVKFFLPVCIAVCLCLIGVINHADAQEKRLSKELNVYNWEDYFAPSTLEDFEKKFGVKVNLKIFEDEEEMVAGFQSYPDKYDVAITSGDMIRQLVDARLLAEIDRNNIPNMKNIEHKFRNRSFDPGNRYSVPYMWGTSGIIVNRKFVKEENDSWNILWNPEYKGKIAMLNNTDEVIGAALKTFGYSINSQGLSELEEARRKTLQQKELVSGYLDTIDIRSRMISGQLWAAQIYSGEGVFATDKNEDLEYIIPEEGVAIWIDNFVIPRDSPHKYTAEVFINYVLDAKVSAKIANYLWYANCNFAARPYTLEEIINEPALYPSEEILKRCEFFEGQNRSNEVEKIRNKISAELGI